MPDLGKYAFEVTLAYAGSLAMLTALVLISFLAARKSKARLDDAENRTNDG